MTKGLIDRHLASAELYFMSERRFKPAGHRTVSAGLFLDLAGQALKSRSG